MDRGTIPINRDFELEYRFFDKNPTYKYFNRKFEIYLLEKKTIKKNYVLHIDNADPRQMIPRLYKASTGNKKYDFGVTTLNWNDGVIRSVKIDMATQNVRGRPLDLADVRNIAAHEIGHALGLGHSNIPDDLMYYMYDFVETGTLNLPSQCDLEAIYSIYGTNGFLAYEKITVSSIPCT